MHTAPADGISSLEKSWCCAREHCICVTQKTFLSWEIFIFSMKSHVTILLINIQIVYVGYVKVTFNYAIIKKAHENVQPDF